MCVDPFLRRPPGGEPRSDPAIMPREGLAGSTQDRMLHKQN